MTFMVIATYATDAGVTERRERVRAEHLAALKEHAGRGQVVIAGPVLDDAQTPKGSALVVEFESREALSTFLRADAYSREGVWESFEIHLFSRVI